MHDLKETGLVLLSALPISFFFLFQQNSALPVALWFSPLVELNMGSRPFSTEFFLPTGGWRRRRFSVADRDIFPQQAHAKGCKEPAGRLCGPMSGICARTFSDWGSGGWSSQGPLRDRRQHLRRIRRWAVRDLISLKATDAWEKTETSFCVDIEWGKIMKLDLLEMRFIVKGKSTNVKMTQLLCSVLHVFCGKIISCIILCYGPLRFLAV